MANAKKGGKPVTVAKEEKAERGTRAVRLDLADADFDKLDQRAKKIGLSKSSYVRMIILKHLMNDSSE